MDYKLYDLDLDELQLSTDLCTEKSIAEEYSCTICLNLPLQPKKCTECKKILCASCLQKISSLNDKCPCCTKPLIPKNLGKMSLNTLNIFTIRCPNINCFETFKFEKLTNHLNTCPFTKRKAICTWCGNIINTYNSLAELKTHLNNCETFPQNNFTKDNELNKNSKHNDVQFLEEDIEDAYNIKGYALGKLKKYKEAIVCYNKAIEINPGYADAYNNKGNALYNLKKYKEAIVCYNKAIKIDPGHTEAYFNKDML
jgi:tetratricopeptide (TPR) repeat protein